MSKKQKPKQKVVKKQPIKALSGLQQAGIALGIILVIVALIWAFVSFSQGPSVAGTPTESSVAPGLEPEPAVAPQTSGKQYASAPEMTVDVKKQYFATFKMAKGGEFVVQLFPDKAPITVNNFVFLARDGFYDGTTFHRVLQGFMAQGGDPTGTGMGGPGYEFVNERSDLAFDKPGVMAMANAGPDTNGSQFFIMFDAGGLSGNDYTIFGQVTSGMDVVNAITLRDPSSATFSGDAIQSVTITEK